MKKYSIASADLHGQPMFGILQQAQELERQGRNIIHFELGDPDFDTPGIVIDAAYEAMQAGHTHYCPSTGIMELKQAAVEVTEKSRGFRPSFDQLLVTPGANAAIYYALACICNQRFLYNDYDEVIVPDPGFVSYYSILDMLGAKIVTVPLSYSDCSIDPNDVINTITKHTRAIILNSPSNPTGIVLSEGDIREIYEIAKAHDIWLISDEIYARMIYGDVHFSPGSIDKCLDRVVIINGFSKSYAMTGWRLGVATGPPELIRRMGLMLETVQSCVSPFIQLAGVKALEMNQDYVKYMLNQYRLRRGVMVEGLNSIPGIYCNMPQGAFYCFPNIVNTGLTDWQFCDLMLEKAGVAISPGSIFGKNGEGHVRLCYANSVEDIREGIKEMKEALRK